MSRKEDYEQTLYTVWYQLLEVVENLCRKHNLPFMYYADTVKPDHPGIAVWRADYSRFLELATAESEGFYFHVADPTKDVDEIYPHARLYRNGSIMQLPGIEPLQVHQGIYLNIFAIDAVANGIIGRKVQFGKYQAAQIKVLAACGISGFATGEGDGPRSTSQAAIERNAAMQTVGVSGPPKSKQQGVIFPLNPAEIERYRLTIGPDNELKTEHAEVVRQAFVQKAKKYFDQLAEELAGSGGLELPTDCFEM